MKALSISLSLFLACLGLYLMIEGFGTGLPPEVPRTYESFNGQRTVVPLNAGHGLVGLLLIVSSVMIAVTCPRAEP